MTWRPSCIGVDGAARLGHAVPIAEAAVDAGVRLASSFARPEGRICPAPGVNPGSACEANQAPQGRRVSREEVLAARDESIVG
jgi:hypothetical protein